MKGAWRVRKGVADADKGHGGIEKGVDNADTDARGTISDFSEEVKKGISD